MKLSRSSNGMKLSIHFMGGLGQFIWGILLFLLSIYFWLIYFSHTSPDDSMKTLLPPLIMDIFAFIILGARSRFVIDVQKDRIYNWKGVFFPIFCREQGNISQCQRISIKPEMREIDETSHKSVVYVTSIEKNNGDVIFVMYDTYLVARRFGEAIAKLLHLSLYDASFQPPIERSAESLDESIAEQWHKKIAKGIVLPSAPKPIQLQSQIKDEPEKLEIRLPPRGILKELPLPIIYIIRHFFHGIIYPKINSNKSRYILG